MLVALSTCSSVQANIRAALLQGRSLRRAPFLSCQEDLGLQLTGTHICRCRYLSCVARTSSIDGVILDRNVDSGQTLAVALDATETRKLVDQLQ